MLPTGTDNGGRLAAIVPTGLVALASGLSTNPGAVLTALGLDDARSAAWLGRVADQLPRVTSLVIVAVDGLGSANLKARLGHAPTLASLPQRRITTVTPSTTAAALTALTTGTLPGVHGLVGYSIRHPKHGMLSPLRDWDLIDDIREWEHSEPLFEVASTLGAQSFAYGRPAHADSGFSRAILTGAAYIGGARIADRFNAAKQQILSGGPTVAYVYADELDRAGHRDGWQSDAWSQRLEQFDTALADFLTGLPHHVGVVVTADHGMVDVQPHQQIVFDMSAPEFDGVVAGGEPRFRNFYLPSGADPQRFVRFLTEQEGKRAWVVTREQIIASGTLGAAVPDTIAQRLGDVVVAARAQCAYYTTLDDPRSLEMIGQHGSWTDEERGIPLILAGAFAGSGFVKAAESLAQIRS